MDLTPSAHQSLHSQPASRHMPSTLQVYERSIRYESWAAVKIPQRLHGITRVIVGSFLLCILVLGFVLWTQTIKAQGQLSAYSPGDRPQEVHAPIEGRIQTWHVNVNERLLVNKGDLLFELVDVNPKFMVPDLFS